MKRHFIFTATVVSALAVAVNAMTICWPADQRSNQDAAAIATNGPAPSWFTEIFYDFDFLGSSPINYKYVSSSKRSFPLAEPSPLLKLEKHRLSPGLLESGRRYVFRTTTLKHDPFYQQLEKRFSEHGLDTSIFVPHSVMAVVYDPPIPVRFVDKPALVLQPMSLVFRGKGYEGVLIRDESEQVSTKRHLSVKTKWHDYSLLILKVPD